MYITGGVGQSHYSECYTVPYDLDNIHAYSESCACISLLMFCLRMQKFGLNSAYADTIERILYNNLLSSISLDGKAFFYENPLEIDLKETYKDKLHHPAFVSHMPKTQRSEVMETSCCPPNIIRTIAKIGDVIYSVCNDGVVINQFISSAYSDGDMRVEISTNYPFCGVIKATFDSYKYKNIYIRKPDYVKDFCLTLNGQEVFTAVENGYIKVGVDGKGEIVLSFDISPVFVYANINVRWNAGKVAVMRGPVVYMAEGIDNGNGLYALKIDTNAHLKEEFDDFCPFPTIIAQAERETSCSDLYSTTPPKFESTQVILRPYFTFANRGESDMAVYLRRK